MIYSIQLTEPEESITVTHYEGDPVKLKAEILRLNGDQNAVEVSLLEKDVRNLISSLVCTLPDARRFIQDDRYGREWKAKAMTWKKEELVEQLQKAKMENLWLIDQIQMRDAKLTVNSKLRIAQQNPKRGICNVCNGTKLVKYDSLTNPCPFCTIDGA